MYSEKDIIKLLEELGQSNPPIEEMLAEEETHPTLEEMLAEELGQSDD